MRINVTAHVLTHRGRARKANEDAIGIGTWWSAGGQTEPLVRRFDFHAPILCVVADGIGGHACGEIASEIAVRSFLEQAPALVDHDSLRRAVEVANEAVHLRMDSLPMCVGMGCTLAAVATLPGRVLYINVGDSRIYELGQTLPQMISVDDVSAVRSSRGRVLKRGLTQSLGGSPFRMRLAPHFGEIMLDKPKRLLICSDGLSDMVDDLAVGRLMTTSDSELVYSLFTAAMEAGGNDNITMAVLSINRATGV